MNFPLHETHKKASQPKKFIKPKISMRFVDLIAIVEHIPKLDSFPEKCQHCGHTHFSSESLMLVSFDGMTATFDIACQKCGYANIRVSLTSGINIYPGQFQDGSVPKWAVPAIAEIEKAMKSSTVTVNEIFWDDR